MSGSQRQTLGTKRAMFMLVPAMVGAALGCAGEAATGEEGAGGTSGEDTGSETERVQSALDSCAPCGASSYSSVSVSNGNTVLGPDVNTHICWPGRYDSVNGAAPQLIVRRDFNGSSRWSITGRGRVECVPQCCFFSNGGGGDVRWVSEDFLAVAFATNGATDIESSLMWADDAMPILSGVYHTDPGTPGGMKPASFSGGKPEGAAVFQGPAPIVRATVKATAGFTFPQAIMAAHAYSFFVGRPHDDHQLKRTVVTSQWGIGTKTLIPETQGICTITDLAGVGVNAVPRVFRSGGNWQVQVSGTNNNSLAAAVCFYFNQNQP